MAFLPKKRPIRDKLISGFNSVRYAATEPVNLKIARARYGHLYKNPEKSPLVSVCVPTYNRGQLLIERAVSSVLAQTYRNFEFIIVGDQCTDNTEELISKINDPRVRFYNLPKRVYRYPPTAENHWKAGPVVPANKGLEMVTGRWIARLDDDDIWTPDHLEALLRFAQEGDYEFVSASYIEERNGKRTVIDVKDKIPRIGGSSTWLYRSYLRFFKYNINCWRKSWNSVNDTDMRDRIYKAGVRIGFLEKIMSYILPRPCEVTLGSDAYSAKAAEMEKHFEFK